MEENTKKSSGLSVVLILVVIILLVAVVADVLASSTNFKDLFSQTIVNKTEREVTVTDKGIADAVEKMYDATVVVKVGQSSWGSGVVYKQDDKYAYILTNHHVVEQARQITIMFTDETETEGTLVGSDEYADVAVVKVDAKTIKAVAEVGSSEELRVGDTVFAVGTPINLAYSFTVTRGILSGKNRLVAMSNSSNSYYQQSSDSWYMNLLQIDASINSDNSGGPLSNSNGEVIGITNSKLSSSGSLFGGGASIENMGFAIPIEDAISVASQLEKNGKVTRPVLGVSMTTVEGAAYNGITIPRDVTYGAVVAELVKGGVAEEAGIKVGDVIIKMDGKKVNDYMYLKYYLYRYTAGDTITFTVIRDGAEKEIKATLR